MNPIRTGLIGCGPRGEVVAKAAANGRALRLLYACDLIPDRAEKIGRQHGLKTTADYREILKDPSVEAVIVATDVHSHLAIAEDVLAAQKHMILEKPMGGDIAGAKKLAALSKKTKCVAYISFQLRFLPTLAAAQKRLPEIDPIQIFFGRSRGMMKPQFLNPSPFCGILDVCAHDFDLASWFMGRTPRAVTSVLRRNTFTSGTGAVDTLSALIDYGDGRCAAIVSTIGAAEIGTKCDVAGRLGNLSLSPDGKLAGVQFQELGSEGAKNSLEFKEQLGPDPDVNLHQAFQNEIASGERGHAARLVDGLNSLLLGQACLRSMEENRMVKLEEFAQVLIT